LFQTESGNILDDFFEEAKLMKAIPTHPNVVHYYGVSVVNKEILVVMEVCDKYFNLI
jgi:serine/threonine protein kinase